MAASVCSSSRRGADSSMVLDTELQICKVVGRHGLSMQKTDIHPYRRCVKLAVCTGL